MRRDRPKAPRLRLWQVKLRGIETPIDVEAEHRSAARHYAKCVAERPELMRKGAIYPAVEWAWLKR
jgi:hypothetical protein